MRPSAHTPRRDQEHEAGDDECGHAAERDVAGGVVLAGAGTVLAEWGALSIQSYDVGIRGFDSLWYHLPWAASFAQTGNVASLRFTDVPPPVERRLVELVLAYAGKPASDRQAPAATATAQAS